MARQSKLESLNIYKRAEEQRIRKPARMGLGLGLGLGWRSGSSMGVGEGAGTGDSEL